MKKIPQDIIGNIAILKFKRSTPFIIKKIKAYIFLKKHKNIKTVVEKIEKFSTNLRVQKTRHLAGEKTKEAIYKENNCIFKLNIDKTYFSPRLSNERKLIAEKISAIAKNGSKILVMFSGVAPYPIVIAKKLKQKKIKVVIYSNEINKKAVEYAKLNIKLNKVEDYIKTIHEDARNLPNIIKEKFDFIVMPRPNIKETFLEAALAMSKKGTIIFYHGFGKKEEVEKELRKSKIKNFSIKKAGDIAPYKFRWLAEFKV